MTATRVLAACALAGCGRIDFAPLGDAAATASTCPADAIFCDGFESGDISAWTGNIKSPGGTTTRSWTAATERPAVAPAHIGACVFACYVHLACACG